MADTFYATLELKNIRMEGLLFSFLEKYEQNAIFCDRIWPKETYEFSSQWHFNRGDCLIDVYLTATKGSDFWDFDK